MAEDRAQLAWVHRNRTKRTRTVPLGNVVKRWAVGLDTAESGLLPDVTAAVDRIVDDVFRGYCRVHSIRNGIMRISVSQALSVAWIQRQWRLPVLELVRAQFPGAGLRDVRFLRDEESAGADVVV